MITEIIVHCSATTPSWFSGKTLKDKTAEIKLWHTRDRGFKDIGYHYLIDRDGRIGPGRMPETKAGAHVIGHNTGTIGVCLIGGHGSASTDKFEDNFTAAQEKSLLSLIDDIRSRYPTITKVTGHNQYAAKACPGFYVPTWYENKKTTPKPVAKKTILDIILGWLKK